MDGATFEEKIGDNIQKGDGAKNFEAMVYVCACFQAVLGDKESVKCEKYSLILLPLIFTSNIYTYALG